MDLTARQSISKPRCKLKPAIICTLHCPRHRVARHKENRSNFVMVRRKYKIEAYLRHTRKAKTRYFIFLDKSAGPSLIKFSLITRELQYHTTPSKDHISLRGTSRLILMKVDTSAIIVNVRIRTSTTMTFNVMERLETDSISGCNFWDAHVETVCTRQRFFKLTDSTAVPIIKATQSFHQICSHTERVNSYRAHGRASRQISVNKTAALHSQFQSWVLISTRQVCLVQIKAFLRRVGTVFHVAWCCSYRATTRHHRLECWIWI